MKYTAPHRLAGRMHVVLQITTRCKTCSRMQVCDELPNSAGVKQNQPTRRRVSTRLGDRQRVTGLDGPKACTSLDTSVSISYLLALSLGIGSHQRRLPTTPSAGPHVHKDSYIIYRMWVGGRNREAQTGHSLSQSWLLQLRPHS